MSVLDRILLLATGLLAGYQVAAGIEGLDALPTACYTIAFGVLLIASLLLIILGFEILESPWVVVVAALIPLSLSLGLVWDHLPALGGAYVAYAVLGLLAIAVTRRFTTGTPATMTLATVHGIAGLFIVGLPIFLSLRGDTPPGFALVGVGGVVIGVGGLLLTFLRAGRPILPATTVLALLPGLLLLTTAAFVAGFAMG